MKKLKQWKLLIICLNKNRYLFKRIMEEVSKSNINISIIHYSDIEINIDQETKVLINGSNLPKFDAVILDAPQTYTVIRNFLVSLFSKNGIYILNGESLNKWLTLSKLTQIYELQNKGIPVIPSRMFGNKSQLMSAATHMVFPRVAKSIDGSSGRNVWEIKSSKDLQETPLQYHAPYHLLIQPKINAPMEFRVIVLGNKVFGAVIKTPVSGEFRANWSQGATLSKTDLPAKVKNIAIRSCQVLKCDFAGIDILYSKNKGIESCWVLEVNRLFGFEGFEQTTEINVASALLNWITKKLETMT